ncbi:MAG TPA: glycosyl transferase, partial [Isosphaeraceae bacterium]|nr:glycosyl transferase [Isosphaeraceae bacterium]
MPTSSPPTRALSPPANPSLSVVVASVNGWDLLEPTLRSLDALPERSQMQIIVVDRAGSATREKLRAREPSVELVETDERLSIPRLRYMGVCQARG